MEIDETSPTLKPIESPSKANIAVPTNAAKADIHVGIEICLPNNTLAKKGTNFTFKYNKNPDRCAVVVPNPIA